MRLVGIAMTACLALTRGEQASIPGGERAWSTGPRTLVRLERNVGQSLIRVMRLGMEENQRAMAVVRGERKRNAKGVDFSDPNDEFQFGRVVRLSRQVAMLFLGHAVAEALLVCRAALHTGSPVLLTGLGQCVDEVWYAYFILGASTAFEAIAADEGSDHDNLMSAIQKLSFLWNRFRVPMLVKTLLAALRPVFEQTLAPHLHSLGEHVRTQLASTMLGRCVCQLSPSLRSSTISPRCS